MVGAVIVSVFILLKTMADEIGLMLPGIWCPSIFGRQSVTWGHQAEEADFPYYGVSFGAIPMMLIGFII